MGMRITVPWQIRLPEANPRSPRSGNWWNRRHYKDTPSVPTHSVMMKEDDLDHLGALHHVIEHRSRR